MGRAAWMLGLLMLTSASFVACSTSGASADDEEEADPGRHEERLYELEARVTALEVHFPTPTSTPIPPPTPTAEELAFTKYQSVNVSVGAMMVGNHISVLPNPSALASGSGTGGCDTGTNDPRRWEGPSGTPGSRVGRAGEFPKFR